MADDPVQQKKLEACSFVIFGVTGDLAHRLIIPALYNLASKDLLPDDFCVVGVARKPMSNDELRTSLLRGLHEFATRPVDDAVARRLLACVTCIAADPNVPGSFENLDKQLDRLKSERKSGGNRLYYLATPPNAFAPISRELGRCGMLREHDGVWRRFVIEKPFGTDLASAKALNDHLLKVAGEQQIYRIDHYLGKETVQNILVLRFANGMFEPIWNRNHIDHVQITVEGEARGRPPRQLLRRHRRAARHAAEPPVSVAVAGRHGTAGALRCSRRPLGKGGGAHIDPDAERGGGAAEFGSRPVYARRGSGMSRSRDFLKTDDISPDSTTETYVALKLTIDNWRWAGVPFYLRTGKALSAKRTEVAIKFKQAPFAMFRADAGGSPVAELSGDRHRGRSKASRWNSMPRSRVRRLRSTASRWIFAPGFFQGRAEHGL